MAPLVAVRIAAVVREGRREPIDLETRILIRGKSASVTSWAGALACLGIPEPAGELGSDRPIPPEAQIQQEFGVARETARRAVALLREEGYVVTAPGLGTYVRRR